MHEFVDPADTAARVVWGEARSEGVNGMQGILNVILKRVAHPGWWGDNILDVCLAKDQFDCMMPTDPNYEKLITVTNEDPQFKIALMLAKMAVAGTLPDITGGADSYYSIDIPAPYWADETKFTRQINHLRFYDLEGQPEPSLKAPVVQTMPEVTAGTIPAPIPIALPTGEGVNA